MSKPDMGCREARPYLSAYIDGELDSASQERVKEHLASCAACRQTIARYQAVDDILGELPATSPSPEVLDRVLGATYSVNRERAVRQSLYEPDRPISPHSVPAFLLADTNLAAPIRLARQSRQRVRSQVLSFALPALAALLIVTLTVILFNSRRGQISTKTAPPPQYSIASEVALTHQKVYSTLANQLGSLGFTPVLPSTLPAGAKYSRSSIGTGSGGAKYLDVFWTLDPPYTKLHLRETTVPLDQRADYVITGPSADSTWQIPGDPQWITMTDGGDTGLLVVGQNQPKFSITLDVEGRGGNLYPDSLDAPGALTYLRLTSLSMDEAYQPIDSIAAPDRSLVVHYQMATTGENDSIPYRWDVYWDPQHGKGKAALYEATGGNTAVGVPIYTDYLMGTVLTRCNMQGCERIQSQSGTGDPFALGTKVDSFFENITGDVLDGELWNLGMMTAPPELGIGSQRVYALAYVGGPYPITIYVSSISKQIVGAISQIGASSSPGVPDAQSPFVAIGSVCPQVSYPLIAFGSATSTAFQWTTPVSPVGSQSQPQIATVSTCTQD